MAPPRVLCLVLAGGQGSRLGPLTTGRAKPSLPVGGHYRLIDVSLSNTAHSGLTDVWVLQQYEPHLLNEHLAGGRPWDLDRTHGGFRALPPFQGHGRDGFATGNADALARNWSVIEAFAPDVLLVSSADHLFRLDYRPVIEAHVGSGAAATVVTTTLPRGHDLTRYLLVDVDGDRVRSMAYKPDDPKGRVVGTEVFAYRPADLHDHLVALQREGGDLGDYGERLLPRLLEAGPVTAVGHEGHWRDLGTPEAYLDGQLDLLGPRPALRLDDPSWPILTSMPVRGPAVVHRTAEIDQAWLSPGATVAGTVVNSILGPGVVVERGAEVRHSVLMGDVTVRAGASVRRSVLAEEVVVGKGAEVGAVNARHPVLVGTKRHIKPGDHVEAGTHVEPRQPRALLRSAT
ncbi:MAG TPA: sugar phosphate nucleotidyltransferase [Aquihabitans sp.]|jgi:glucose-1-phosphate adenylyltransferase|nr:sugar phosphate nucleotidyltransferase [Aquihabitans sp.]